MMAHGIVVRAISHYLPPPLSDAGWVLAICVAVTAAAAWGLGRLSRDRAPMLTAVVAPGLAILLGWCFATGIFLPPHGVVARLAGAGVGTLLAGLWLHRLGGKAWFWPVLAMAALLLGWWLGDTPVTLPDIVARLVPMGAAAACVGVLGGVLAGGGAWMLAVAAAGLAIAFYAAGAPAPWPLLACVPLAACIGKTPPPPATGKRRRPAPPPRCLPAVALAIALAAGGALAAAVESRAHVGAVAGAVLAPLVLPWFVAALAGRLRWLGAAAGAAAAVLGLAIFAITAFSAAALAGLR